MRPDKGIAIVINKEDHKTEMNTCWTQQHTNDSQKTRPRESAAEQKT